jgi:hypothetical protein
MSQSDGRLEGSGNGRAVIGIALLLALFAALAYSAAWTKSPTTDEPIQAAAGYLIRWCGDYRVDMDNPALFPLLGTLLESPSSLGADLRDPDFEGCLLDHRKEANFVVRMMFRTPHTDPAHPEQTTIYDGPAYIDRARIVFTAIAVSVGAMMAWWAYRLAGKTAALIATAMFALDPNFLGHGPLVKNDVVLVAVMLWLMISVWMLGKRATWLRIFSVTAASACAVNVKFSGLLLIGLLLVMLVIRSLSGESWSMFGRDYATRTSRLLMSCLIFASVLLISWGTTWLLYRGRYSVSGEQMAVFDRAPLIRWANAGEIIAADPSHVPSPQEVRDHPLSLTSRLILWADDHRLFPNAWSMGLYYIYIATRWHEGFLLGQYSNVGWWYYFPLAALFKTPVATLTMGLVAIGWHATRGRTKQAAGSRWSKLCLVVPIVLYGLVAVQSHLNTGFRHILEIYPFLYLLIAIALSGWIAATKRTGKIVTGILIAALTVETLSCWPDYISFFNVACGGERGGVRLLGDSNIDWGQDLPLLAEWQQQHPDRLLYLSFFGGSDPKYYGIRYIQVGGGWGYSDQPVEPMDRPGVFAVSATNLQGIYYNESARARMKLLLERKPIAVLGGSIYLYDWNPAEFRAGVEQTGKP